MIGTDLFTGYSHTGIYVIDRESAIRFYEDVLGFKLLFKVDNESDGILIAMLKLGGCFIEVLELPQNKDTVISGAKATINHIAVTVSDINAAIKHIESFGYTVEEDKGIVYVPRFGSPDLDLRVAFFRGLNGERIELFQEIHK